MTDLQLAQFLDIGAEAGCRSSRFSMAGPCNKVGLAITCLRSSRSRGSIRTTVTSRTVGYGISPPTLAAMGMRRGSTAGRHEPLTTAFLKVFGRRPNTVQTNGTLSWPAFENLQRRKPREKARRAVPRSAYQPARRAGFLYNLRVMARRLLNRGK